LQRTSSKLSGNLSSVVIGYHIHNAVEDYCKNYTEYCSRLNEFVNQSMQWIKRELASKNPDDIYWAQVYFVIQTIFLDSVITVTILLTPPTSLTLPRFLLKHAVNTTATTFIKYFRYFYSPH
uniref:Phospholipase B-like n=1 Tax=Ascaris lumbricoides TaxID=6252 RepID=A0A0M3HIL9_ASCLU